MNRASKLGNKRLETFDPKMESKKKPSYRNPLKDLNIINSCGSSTSSLSVEAPKGCLSFFLLNSSSKTPLHRPKTLLKTPKSAPNPRPSKPRSKPPINQRPNKPISETLKKATSENPLKAKRTPCFYRLQKGKTLSFTKASQQPHSSPVLDDNGTCANNNLSLEEEEEEDEEDRAKQQQWSTNMINDTGKPDDLRLFSARAGIDENVTPLNKLASGSGSGSDSTAGETMEEKSTTTTTTPPVQPSISPEIQCGSSSLLSTPTCFGAGHVVSGVTDKRKCRPRGILTVGEDLGFCKASVFNGVDDDSVLGLFNNSRVSLVPAPSEASMHWLLSPCDEEEENQIKGSPESTRLMGRPFTIHSPSSSSSGHGISSDVSNSASTWTGRKRASPSEISEFVGLVGPCLSSVSQIKTPPSPLPPPPSSCKAIKPQEERGYRYSHAGENENSPFSCDSLGSGNMICTPQSDSSSDRRLRWPWMNAEHQLELDSMVELLSKTNLSPQSRQIIMGDAADVLPLPGLSFQFAYPITTPSNSIHQLQIQKPPLNDWGIGFSSSSFENASQSQMRISWRDGLVSRIFDMDELDCCRWLSDEEEEEITSCGDARFKSDCDHEHSQKANNDQTLTDGFASIECANEEPGIDGKSMVMVPPPQRPSSCAESISTEGGGLVASGDSDWTLCYKNQLFEEV